ncbi:type II/IV secretion system ATPase subunit [Methanosarcina sp. KYL-1]|uniref:type II/IV secretion system ATPase subunit n=1 Tax=Methanosarcina sp. KYL-1 TaxID=2602068 RepID=UPI002100C611|nr:type II/IV secretion system ATPase subunit [Methanosarcina sp. KYL-1]
MLDNLNNSEFSPELQTGEHFVKDPESETSEVWEKDGEKGDIFLGEEGGLDADPETGLDMNPDADSETDPDAELSPSEGPGHEKKVNIILETESTGIFPPKEEIESKKLRDLGGGTEEPEVSLPENGIQNIASSAELKKVSLKTDKKKKAGFSGNMKGLIYDIAGIKSGEKLGDKVKEFLKDVKTPEGAKQKFAEIMRKLNEEEIRILPPYDPETYGPLLEYEIPAGFIEVERYWVEEPYAFVSIIENMEMKFYYTVEPTLSAYEKSILERVRDNLEDTLTQEDMNSGSEKEIILTNKALRLLDQYYSTLELPSLHKIMYFLKRNFIGYERINPLILDPNIEDISCSGVEIPIYLYHRKHNNIVTNILFGEKELDSLVVKLCQRSGKHISIGEPIVDATLPDGSRIQATLGREVTTRGSSYTIRKFKGDPITPIDLLKYGTCSIEMMAYYWIAIENNISVLLAGGTASGKTSLMNAISLFIPRLSKIVSIEDTREIMLHHENWIAGATRKSFTVGGTGEVSMYELLKAALRQRPEYIIVGEVRGKEALTLFQAMSTGHTTYSTMHASDVQTVVNRLENEPINVPHVMMQALGVIAIQMQTYVDEVRVRRTKTIVEITGLDARTGSLRINELYRWEPQYDNFKRAGDSYVLNEIMRARGWNPDKLFIEFKNREKILAYMAERQIRDYVSVSLIVHMYATNPQLVMEAVGNDTLRNMVQHHSL